MFDLESLFGILIWTLNILTILVLIAFFYRSVRFKHTHYGLHMILMPNIGNLIYSMVDILGPSDFWENDIEIETVKAPFAHFSMYSSAAFAMFTYMVLSSVRSPKFTPIFVRNSLLICLMWSLILGIM